MMMIVTSIRNQVQSTIRMSKSELRALKCDRSVKVLSVRAESVLF